MNKLSKRIIVFLVFVILIGSMPSQKASAYNLEVPTITNEEFENYEYTKVFLAADK